jgi:hypothetical protein
MISALLTWQGTALFWQIFGLIMFAYSSGGMP